MQILKSIAETVPEISGMPEAGHFSLDDIAYIHLCRYLSIESLCRVGFIRPQHRKYQPAIHFDAVGGMNPALQWAAFLKYLHNEAELGT